MAETWFIVPAEQHDSLVARAYRARGYSEEEADAGARFCHSAARHGIRTHNALKALHLDDLFGSKVGRWAPGAKIEKLPSRFAAAECVGWTSQARAKPWPTRRWSTACSWPINTVSAWSAWTTPRITSGAAAT